MSNSKAIKLNKARKVVSKMNSKIKEVSKYKFLKVRNVLYNRFFLEYLLSF